jgi:toxin ParE1/3/4
MNIVWTLLALADRDAIFDHIAQDSPEAAARVDHTIETHVDLLATSPELGRPGRVAGTRELVIARTPYIAAYQLQHASVKILRLLHGAQQWPHEL